MANSSVPITPGTGTQVDTELPSGGDHRQVIVIGDPNTIGNVLPVVAKGTQGSFAIPVQNLNNAGRSIWAARSQARMAGVTAEALFNLTANKSHVTQAAATSLAVSAGKRLRLTGMQLSITSSAAAMAWARICLRAEANAAVSATSPIIVMQEIGMSTSLANQVEAISVDFGADGIEFTGTEQIGMTQIASATTALIGVSIYGYEY